MKKSSMQDEIIRCGRDPVYFINKYVKIRHPTKGLIPFKTFPYQDKTLESFLSKRSNIILKARQMGFTEITSAFITWLMLFHKDISVMCLATKSETAKNVIRRVRVALKNIPRWLLLADIVTDNKTSIELANGSWCKSVAKSSDAGRSEALSLLVIDEAAHIEGFDEIWTGIKPTVSAGGRIIMLSTPNGVGNVFHKLYTEALENKNEFTALRTDWWEHPEHISDLKIDEKTGAYTSSWFRKEIRGFSSKQVAQEYLCEFLTSGDTYFSADSIAKVEVIHYDGNEEERMWAKPVAGEKYIIGADSATGDGRDSSAFHVFPVSSMEQVYEFSAKIHPKEYAEKLMSIGYMYNTALLVLENNAVGLAVIEHIMLANYPNFFYSKKNAKIGDRLGEVGHASRGSMGADYSHGINTSSTNRTLMLNKLEELMRLNAIKFKSSKFKSEMETFIWNNGRPEARGGKTDDLIMAAAFAVWVRDQYYGGQYNTFDLVQAMVNSMKVEKKNNAQIHGASKNPDHVPSKSMGVFSTPQNPYLLKMPNGSYINIAQEFGMFRPRKG